MSEGTVRFEGVGDLDAKRFGIREIDLAGHPGDQHISAHAPPGAEHVVLDLTEVEHIDSYGIFVIHGLRQRLREHQTRLVLVIPQGWARHGHPPPMVLQRNQRLRRGASRPYALRLGSAREDS